MAVRQATPVECCPGCGKTLTKAQVFEKLKERLNVFEKLKERLNERRKNLKNELEELEMDLNSLDELKIYSQKAAQIYDSRSDEIGMALADEGGSDPALLDELQMKAQNAARLYNSSIVELEEAMSKITVDFVAKNEEHSEVSSSKFK